MRTKTTKATKTETDVVYPSHLKGSTLPPDWEWVSLGNICRTTSGGTPSRKNKEYFEGDIPWVKSGELPDGPVSEVEEYITGEAVKNSSAKQFPKGTLLIALYGATVGKLGVLTKEAATNQAVCAIFPPDYLETKYLFWYLRFVRSDLVAQAIGGAQPNISQGIIRNLLIPVAPPLQQKRIVAEIEKQFSRLDEAVANLKRVKANLKRYKAAVLKAAVEGCLTRMKVGGSRQHEVTRGWRQAPVGEAIQIIDYRGRTPPFSNSGIPHLRSSNIKGGRIVWENLAYVTGQTYDAYMTRGLPQEGDVLFTTEAPLGEVALAPKEKFSVAQRMMILRPKPELLKSRFLMVQLMSPQFHAKLRHRGTGSTVTGVSSRNFQPLPLLIPPIEEQEGIADEVERRLSVIEELESAVEANLTRADRLRQSILSRAFSGDLVSMVGVA